ncbi:MAG: hypothetical protein RLZZ04_3058 [Cyanobacteriota bacterium]|jgi:hypothetical protein
MQITEVIQKTPGVSGGHACIRNTRIPVWTNDFIELHNKVIQHSGIIICKIDRDYQAQIDFLNEYLQTQDTLINRLIRIKKQQKKDFSQQVFVVQEYFR